METTNYIALAIPFFFLFIGIELFVNWRRKASYYRLNDSVNNLSCGIGEQMLGIFFKGLLFAIYLLVYDRFRLLDVSTDSPTAWALGFLGVDICYYWFHRASHEVSTLWSAHVVHHQSEDYNLTVALRQAWFQKVFSIFFYVPLALVGLPPVLFLALNSFNTLYQFWIHTRAIGKLGPLEWVLNTPSHHRVHHGSNPKYLDKNYAGTFIIWDRLFGSFQEEEEEPCYGLVKPLRSWNPIWANFHIWKGLLEQARQAENWQDKIKVWLMPPGWQPGQPRTMDRGIDVSHRERYDASVSTGLGIYVLVQLVAVTIGAVFLLDSAAQLPLVVSLVLCAGVLVSLFSLGTLLEKKSWSLKLELFRLLLIGSGGSILLALGQVPTGVGSSLVGLAAGSGLWVLRYRAELSPRTAAVSVPITPILEPAGVP